MARKDLLQKLDPAITLPQFLLSFTQFLNSLQCLEAGGLMLTTISESSRLEFESKQFCTARLDRVRIVGGARWPAQLPTVRNFTTVSDSFVGAQTSVRTYLRSRRLVHRRTGTEIYWQYWPQPRYLKPWRITFIANDSR